jgi:glutamine synthetase
MTSHNQSYNYGVEYSPLTVSPPLEFTIEKLEQTGIRFIRLQWVDLVNNIRFRVIPIAHFKRMLTSSRPSISITKVSLGLVFITTAPGFSAIGEYLYVIDWSSVMLCPYAPGHASVMGYFEEKDPVPGPDGQPTVKVDICPRTILRSIVE